MPAKKRKTIRYRGKEIPVIETFRIRGSNYFAVEVLSHRGAFKVFDFDAKPGGDFRVLYKLPSESVSKSTIEVLRTWGNSNHRNFPKLIQFSRQKSELYVLFEWIEGKDLQTWIRGMKAKELPRFSATECIRLLRGLAHGLSHYHRKFRCVHGDISPANIVLSNSTQQLFLIDFGSAWPVELGHAEGLDGVTAGYAAPESFRDRSKTDWRSDQFAHAVLAHELLALELPFDGLGGQIGRLKNERLDNAIINLTEELHQKNRLPSKLNSELESTLSRALNIQISERFETTSQWLSAWDSLYEFTKQTSRLGSWQSRFADLLARFFNKPSAS